MENSTFEKGMSPCSTFQEKHDQEIYFSTYLMQGIVILQVSLWLGWAGAHPTCQICEPVPCWTAGGRASAALDSSKDPRDATYCCTNLEKNVLHSTSIIVGRSSRLRAVHVAGAGSL